MKFMFIVLLVAVSSCSKENDGSIVLKESFTIKKGTSSCYTPENICLKFEQVNNDSRCPLNAMCIWEGVAEVQLILRHKGTEIPFILHTIDRLSYHSDTIINGYTIKLEQLNPYPNGRSIEQKEYVAQLSMSK